MNKQELIEKYVYMKRNLEMWVCIPDILKDLKQLDQPQKVKIPKFVAECIEYAQASDWDLEDVFQSIANELDTSEISVWFYSKSENMDTLARAWLYGYEIEKEKKYTVKVKAVLGQYLGRYYLNNEELTPQFTRTQLTGKNELPTFTRKELEDTFFGWVFDCPGIEVKEVKE